MLIRDGGKGEATGCVWGCVGDRWIRDQTRGVTAGSNLNGLTTVATIGDA